MPSQRSTELDYARRFLSGELRGDAMTLICGTKMRSALDILVEIIAGCLYLSSATGLRFAGVSSGIRMSRARGLLERGDHGRERRGRLSSIAIAERREVQNANLFTFSRSSPTRSRKIVEDPHTPN